MTDLTPILETARQILSEHKKAMHVNDIAEIAVCTNRNQQLPSDEFAKKLSSALAANLKVKKPAFAKVANKNGTMKRGVYRLKQVRVPAASTVAVAPAVGNNFLGKAGEYAVMSELLFWGYNVSLMSVDEGIDIVASQNNRYFHLQVKTSALNDAGKFTFTIRGDVFAANNNAQTFYIFVMRKKCGMDYAVIPSSHLHHLKNLGVIASTNGLSITISTDEKGKIFFLNRKDNISLYINNFGIIK